MRAIRKSDGDDNRPPMEKVLDHYNVMVVGGGEWVPVLCPVHDDHTRSMSVSLEHNAFKCFACGVSGDSIHLIMEMENCTRSEAWSKAGELFGAARAGAKGSKRSAGQVFKPMFRKVNSLLDGD